MSRAAAQLERPAALAAATKYQQEQTRSPQLHADSTWPQEEAARHKKEMPSAPRDPSGDVARCLVGTAGGRPGGRREIRVAHKRVAASPAGRDLHQAAQDAGGCVSPA